jgi:hypothetical protein
MRDRFRLRAAVACASVACSTLAATALGAELGRGIELTWSAPSGCPDEAWARHAIRGYLGERKLDSAKPIDVRVDITPIAGGRFRAAISLEGGASGDRRFEGASCARVGDAAILIVALMFDPVEVVTKMEAPAERQASERGASSERDRGARGASAARTFEIAFQATGDVGSLPEPTLGAGLVAGVRLGRTLLAADAVAWFPRRAYGGPIAGGGGEIGLLTASLRGCFAGFRAFGTALWFEPCVRGEGGISSGRGFGLAEPTSSTAPWGAAFVGFSIRQSPADSLAAWLSLEGGVAFVRPSYVIEDFGPVFRAAPVLGRAAFGLVWSLP